MSTGWQQMPMKSKSFEQLREQRSIYFLMGQLCFALEREGGTQCLCALLIFKALPLKYDP